eukprot:CAMPEP_0194346890 /NCGR_PEP_ID=MMETSP0171-20130528/105679_1 /TAXON_ID=218684 /ORGANISM="Corethron pennatum, Strain L29A3" /LENGTH=252 /DNA_ID=CAMNT_0039114073 /DNA_START=698 /DNA_END=1458 /DNA_ORIENTATION=-
MAARGAKRSGAVRNGGAWGRSGAVRNGSARGQSRAVWNGGARLGQSGAERQRVGLEQSGAVRNVSGWGQSGAVRNGGARGQSRAVWNDGARLGQSSAEQRRAEPEQIGGNGGASGRVPSAAHGARAERCSEKWRLVGPEQSSVVRNGGARGQSRAVGQIRAVWNGGARLGQSGAERQRAGLERSGAVGNVGAWGQNIAVWCGTGVRGVRSEGYGTAPPGGRSSRRKLSGNRSGKKEQIVCPIVHSPVRRGSE